MLMDLAKQLTILQGEQYSNSSIAKLHWQYGKNKYNETGLSILKKRHHFIKTACTMKKGNMQARLETSLILHCIPQRTVLNNTDIPASAIFWRIFSPTEITDFVQTMGDKNPIHKGPDAIIPGILLLSEVLNTVIDSEDLTMRFYNAALAGQSLYWNQLNKKHVEVYSKKRKVFDLIMGKPAKNRRDIDG
ncbi:hypothetical protein [Pectinatus frisingensis]|jgi:hypothetical protein|uniref:hypothetical protein n=1 Tax=Pectinatus frisingensis TaxID=865 RepID=UPI0015F6D28F|nr:hypothetical protein [Pectinatus frisingensis]